MYQSTMSIDKEKQCFDCKHYKYDSFHDESYCKAGYGCGLSCLVDPKGTCEHWEEYIVENQKTKCVSVIQQSWNEILNEEEAMHNQEQDLKEYYRNIFTLKSGKQIEILTRAPYEEVAIFITGSKVGKIKIDFDKGFIATPLIVEKSIEIELEDIAAIEITKEPHITWKNTELDPKFQSADNKHPEDCS